MHTPDNNADYDRIDADSYEPSPSVGWREMIVIMHCEEPYAGEGIIAAGDRSAPTAVATAYGGVAGD